MNIEITERIPRDKWLAALGTHGTRDESLNETLDEVESALLAAAKPKAIYRVMDIADIKVQGFSLKKHLEGILQLPLDHNLRQTVAFPDLPMRQSCPEPHRLAHLQ